MELINSNIGVEAAADELRKRVGCPGPPVAGGRGDRLL
jgi:hypothetical protein